MALWPAKGPKGDKGDKGDPGTPGVKGDKGDAGTPALTKPKLYVPGRGQATSMLVMGHSLAYGAGLASPATERLSAQMVSMFTELVDSPMLAVSGTDLLYADPAFGGWGALMSNVDQSSASAPDFDLALVFSGINGMSSNNAAYVNAGDAGEATREFVYCYLRAKRASFRKFNNSKFTYSASQWADSTVSGETGNQGTKYTGMVGASVSEEVTVTDSGEHDLLFLQHGSFGVAKWRIEVDGVVVGTVNPPTLNTTSYFPMVFRIKNMLPGTHTVTATLTDLPAALPFAFFMGSLDAAVNPPVLMDVLQYKPVSYAPWGGSPHVPTDADVDTLNSLIKRVQGRFDGYCLTPDFASLMDNRLGMLQSDQLHATKEAFQVGALACAKSLLTCQAVATNPLPLG